MFCIDDLKKYDFNSFLSKEELADLIYCIKCRKDYLVNRISFFTEVIKDGKGKRLELLENCVSSYRRELGNVDLLILKLQNLL